MHGHCNMCGKCCEAITLWEDPKTLLETQYKAEETSDRGWAQRHFKSISHEEAFKRNPLHKYIFDSGHPAYEGVHFYECDAYDKETKRCTAHETRPGICREYPYGHQLDGGWMPYSATCDYINEMPPAMKQEWIAIAEELRKVGTR